MNINKLRHRLTIEKINGSTNDGGGNQLPTWGEVATTWANIRPLRGDEVIVAQQAGQEITHAITMRYRAGIDKKMRLNYNGRFFYILYIINVDEKNEQLQLRCIEDAEHASRY